MTIKINGNSVLVDTPYYPEFLSRVKALGGRWDPAMKVWRFDIRDERRVRDLVAEVFGAEDEPRVTVHILADFCIPDDKWYALGRQIAWRPGRDMAVRLGDNVVVVAGGFKPQGGSMRYPAISTPLPGTVLEVRDVPLSIAQAAANQNPNYKIIDNANQRRAMLDVEATKLRARLAEIEAELASLT